VRRHLLGTLLAMQLAAGLLLPLSVFASPRAQATMACCMMHGRCDCGHSDASFARCTRQDALSLTPSPPASPAPAIGPLAGLSPGERLVADDTGFPTLYDSVPPTPPPRSS
jgi:hypothetical protein